LFESKFNSSNNNKFNSNRNDKFKSNRNFKSGGRGRPLYIPSTSTSGLGVAG
jgi:hypothetical protein